MDLTSARRAHCFDNEDSSDTPAVAAASLADKRFEKRPGLFSVIFSARAVGPITPELKKPVFKPTFRPALCNREAVQGCAQ